MNSFISASRFFGHVLIYLSVSLAMYSCNDSETKGKNTIKSYPQLTLVLSSGEELTTYVAQGSLRQSLGLSGLKDKDFNDHEAMLFPGNRMAPRQYWMPDTYFDLDIFFLDQDFKVIDIQRNVPHHPGNQEPPPIARTKVVFAQHILEIKSKSALAKKIFYAQQLKWKEEKLKDALLGKE